MDALIRDSIFAGLSTEDFLQCVGGEIRRREMAGVLYMLPLDARGVVESYSAVVVPERMKDLSVAETMRVMYMHSMCMPKERELTFKPDGEDWSK